MLALTWLVTEVLYRFLTSSAPTHLQYLRAELTLAADGVLAIGFLVLAIRHSSLWLGAELMIQGATFTLHSLFMSQESDLLAYYIAINLLSLALLITILAGTIASWCGRVAKRRNAARAPRRSGPAQFDILDSSAATA